MEVGHRLADQAESGDPRERIIMEHPHQKKHSGDIRVNLAGINPDLARAEVTATLSLLSEGTTYCAACKEEIPGLAVYFTRPRPDRRDGYDLVAITCPGCAGYEGELA
jgi:hypothetical protein